MSMTFQEFNKNIQNRQNIMKLEYNINWNYHEHDDTSQGQQFVNTIYSFDKNFPKRYQSRHHSSINHDLTINKTLPFDHKIFDKALKYEQKVLKQI